MRARLLVAVTASAAVILAAPFVGQIRAAIQVAFPGQYRSIIGAAVVAALGLVVIAAIRRIRDRRLSRYGALVAALVVGVAYARLTSTGNADVDVVEHFHFVEYGLLTFLFHRAFATRGDVTALLLPVFAGIVVGTLDEWFQWFIPARVGEMRDVLLNAVAIGCGLLFSIGIDPPSGVTLAPDRRSRRTLAAGAAVVIVTGALFFHVVHLGYEIRDPDAGVFRSRFSDASLLAEAADRAVRWRVAPPLELRRVSREDHYLSEGLWHVQRRNEESGPGGVWAAWKENLILETFFAPVLEFSSYAAPAGTRWPPAQRADIAARVAGDARPYTSDANPYPIYIWNRWLFWAVTAMAIVFAAWCCLSVGNGRRAP